MRGRRPLALVCAAPHAPPLLNAPYPCAAAPLPRRAARPQPFGLSRTELLQVLNLAPVSEVEVHLIVDNAEGRLGEERIASLLNIVAEHSPVAARRRAGGGAQAAG